MFEIFCIDNRVVRGIGIYKTGINEDLSAVHQSGIHTLQNNTLEKALENLHSPFLPGFRQYAVVGNFRIKVIIKKP